MPYLTVQEIETIAERIVRAYHRYCAQQNQTVTRIDPEIVTSNVLGLQIVYHKLSRFGHVLGLTCMLPVQIQVFDDVEHPVYEPLDGRTVFVDESLRSENANIGRHNFTLMHEACHLVYGNLFRRSAAQSLLQSAFCTTKRDARLGRMAYQYAGFSSADAQRPDPAVYAGVWLRKENAYGQSNICGKAV